MKFQSPIIWAASGLGALVGLLLGMSASPVVAAVLGALLPFAIGFATWFTSKRVVAKEGDPPPALVYATLVAGFAWTAAAATLLGVSIRTHNWLSPSPSTLKERWMDAGLEEEQALKLLLLQSHPGSRTPETPEDEQKQSGRGAADWINSALFSGEGKSSIRDLTPMMGNSTLEELKKAYRKRGGILETAVEYSEQSIPESEQKDFLERIFRVLARVPQP